MWNCCLTGVWSSLGAGKVPHHTTRVVICILLSDTQYLWNSTNISTNSGTTMLSSLGGWLFSGFFFTVFTWGPPCHVALSFSKAAKYATKYPKEIVFGKDLSVWHKSVQTDNKSYYWAHHPKFSKEIVFIFCVSKDQFDTRQTTSPITGPTIQRHSQFVFPCSCSSCGTLLPLQESCHVNLLSFSATWSSEVIGGGLQAFPINSMRRLFNLWRKHFEGRNSEPTRLLLNNTWGGALHMSN